MMSSIMATSTPLTDTVSASPSPPLSLPESARRRLTSGLAAILIGAAIVSLGVCGVVYYFVSSGRLMKRWSAAAKVRVAMEPQTRLMVLEPLLVNLADEGGNTYLRLSLTLQIADGAAKKSPNTKDKEGTEDAMAAVRDTALTVLGRQTANNLLAIDGKERLKIDLKKALAEHNPNLKVKQIFFTDFLVQR